MNTELDTLWCKESAPNDNLYIDIISTVSYESTDDEILEKNNMTATNLRNKSNDLFSKKKYHEAMALYNESISYAENDSEVLALGYANRSNCFLKLNQFQQCLNDIALAKNAGYPSSRMPKLDAREKNCKEMMAKATKTSYIREPKLDFDENAMHPGVADCLEIKMNSKFDRHVITTRDLKIGQTVLVEKPFAFKHEAMMISDSFVVKRVIPHDRSGKNTFGRCMYCYAEYNNLIPCKKCAGVLFCNEACMEKAYHQYDCLMMPDYITKETFGMVLRMLYRVNNAFPSVDELMQTVKSLLAGNKLNALQNGDQKNFAMIFQLSTKSGQRNFNSFPLLRKTTKMVYNKVMRLSDFNEKFTSLEHHRFLQHLILHLFHVGEHAINASEYFRNTEDSPLGIFRLRTFGNGMYPFGCYINHLCTPNVCWYFVDHRLICRVIRPIKKGQQLFGFYFPGTTLYEHIPHHDRGIFLAYYYLFMCSCIMCSNENWSPFIGRDLSGDPMYERGIEPTWMDLDEIRNLTPDKVLSYERDGANFLEKYDRFHPVQNTMMMQHNLHMLWNTFASRR